MIDAVAATYDEVVELKHPQSGMVLTDDYNPVEYFDAANRQETRMNLVMAMKRR